MKTDVVLVFDCGATNIRVIAVDINGQVHASCSFANKTFEDPGFKGGKIWDIEFTWEMFCAASRKVMNQLDNHHVTAVTVTSFGVDGTLVDSSGKPVHPVISWQCGRTMTISGNCDRYISLPDVYATSGVNNFHFNTLYKLIWLRENHPGLFNRDYTFLFMPSLIAKNLCGSFFTDVTMAGTSMLTNYRTRDFSKEILNSTGIPRSLFPDLKEAGDIVGKTTIECFKQTGIPAGTTVCSSGHDTQFAIFGSGANLEQVVINSGTWEIIMARARKCSTGQKELNAGLTNELDALPGLFNIGQNYIAGGMLEIASKILYHGLEGDELYNAMIREASVVPPGSNGLIIKPRNTGTNIDELQQTISAAGNLHPGGVVTRAIMEGLACRLRSGINALQEAGNFKTTSLVCAGGGSRNNLWNQIKADVLNMPVNILTQKETTALGASMFAFKAAGLTREISQLRSKIPEPGYTFTPSPNVDRYDEIYQLYHNA